MYEVSLAGEAGPVIPAFEAYCCLATGQSTYRWSTHLDSLMSEEDPVGALNGTLSKLRRWSGRALKRILGEFGSGSWARRRVLQWFTCFDISRCYVMTMPVRPRKKILCGVGRGSCVSLEGDNGPAQKRVLGELGKGFSGNALNQQLDEANQRARTHQLAQCLLEYVIGYFLVPNTGNNFIYSLQCNVINNSSKCGNSPVTGEFPNKWRRNGKDVSLGYLPSRPSRASTTAVASFRALPVWRELLHGAGPVVS